MSSVKFELVIPTPPLIADWGIVPTPKLFTDNVPPTVKLLFTYNLLFNDTSPEANVLPLKLESPSTNNLFSVVISFATLSVSAIVTSLLNELCVIPPIIADWGIESSA